MPNNNNVEEYSESRTTVDMFTLENAEAVGSADSQPPSGEQYSTENPAEVSTENQAAVSQLPEASEVAADENSESVVGSAAGEEETTLLTEQQSNFTVFLQHYRMPLIIVFLLILAALCASIAVILKKKSSQTDPVAVPNMYPEQQPISEMPLQNANADDLTQSVTSPYAGCVSETQQADLSAVRILSVQNIGNRPNQEDSFGYSDITDRELTERKGVLGVVADGMGGLAGGEEVSALLVQDMLSQFSGQGTANSADAELDRLLKHAVQEVNTYLSRTVGLKKSGSTLMAVICKEKQLSWVSVGDSRIVLFRNGRLTTLNQRHVYGAELDEMVRLGKMSAEEAQSNTHRGELTSYVGMGELKYVDRSVRPLRLQSGDKVVLMSDGIFNALNDEEIASILQLPSAVIAKTLEDGVLSKQRKYQDNFTALIIEI